MKQIFLRSLAAWLCCALFFSLGACQRVPDPCENGHSYALEWSSDEDGHWRAAVCEHTKERTGFAAHAFGSSNICTVCGYVLPPTEGLLYEQNEEGTGAILTGIKDLKRDVVLVAAEYEGLPVVGIGRDAFSNCLSVRTVILPSGITDIGDSAFCCCSGLERIILPSGLKTIGALAFYSCMALTDITLPSTVTSLGEGVFRDCRSLQEINIPQTIKSIPASAFYGCSSLERAVIPMGASEISEHAFYGCLSLTGLIIPHGVTTIGESAFRGCARITTLTLPETVETIGVAAFLGCTGLTNISFLDTKGWRVRKPGNTSIEPDAGISINVLDPAQNATYLTGKYSEYLWECCASTVRY